MKVKTKQSKPSMPLGKFLGIIVSAIIAFIIATVFVGLLIGHTSYQADYDVVDHTEKHDVRDETIRQLSDEILRLQKELLKQQQENKKLQQRLREQHVKAQAIRRVLGKYHAPLANHAEAFVKYANKYGIDWRLVASISIAESSGGRYLFKPYNAWGYGHYSFRSFDEGIRTVSYGLSLYYKSGCRDIVCINNRYSEGSLGWRHNVLAVMTELLEEYTKLLQS